MKKTILCLVCTFFSLPFVLKAQITTDLYIPEWRVIDSFIVIKDSLAAEKHLSALNERAKKEHNAAQIVKTTLFKVTYRYAQMGFTEGYFEAINDLREATESASFPEKTVFKSLLGEVYRSFLKNNLNHVVSKDLRNIPKNDLRALSKDSIYALSTQWFIESAMDERTKTIPIGLFDALTKPNLLENDVYRPTLYDFLGHRAIEFLKIRPNEYSIYNRFDSYFARQYYRLPIESDSFIKIDLRRFEQSGKDSLDYFLSCMQVLQNLMRFHQLDSNKYAQVDIALRRLDLFSSVYNYNYYIFELEKLSKQYADHPSVIGIIEYLSRYFEENGSNNSNSIYRLEKQYYYKEAYDLCRQAIEKFPNAHGLDLLQKRMTRIRKKQLSCTVEEYILPKKPTLALVKYRNTDSLYCRWIRLPLGFDMAKLGNDSDKLVYFLQQTPVRAWSQVLPSAGDFQLRTVEIKLEAVPDVGQYVLLVSTASDFVSDTSSNQSLLTQLIVVTATNIAAWSINDEDKYVVVNRETGAPMPDVTFQLWRESTEKEALIYSGKSNKDGVIQYSLDSLALKAKTVFNTYHNPFATKAIWAINGDTLSIKKITRFRNNRQDDDEPKRVKAHFFTDRNIYRPGQVIQFQCVMTVYEKRNQPKLLTNKKVRVAFGEDFYFDEALETLVLTTNEFGSVSGSFKAPTNGKLGSYMIFASLYSENEDEMDTLEDTYDLDNETNLSKEFRIEEYKRPRFEVFIDPPKTAIKANKWTEITGRALAFTGSAIDNATVKLTVNSTRYRYYWDAANAQNNYISEKNLVDSTFQTDAKGGFNARFLTTIDTNDIAHEGIYYQFEIFVTVTDLNGEVQSKEFSTTYNSFSFKINCAVPDRINRHALPKIPLSIVPTDEQIAKPIRGSLTLDLLESDIAPFYTKRLWDDDVDTFLYDEARFHRYFPDFEYPNPEYGYRIEYGRTENQSFSEIKRTVWTENFNWETENLLRIKGFKNFEVGNYRLTIKVFDPVSGDSLFRFYFFKLYDFEHKQTLPVNNWDVYFSKPTYSVGETMILQIQTPTPQKHVLYELIRDKKVVVQRWIDVQNMAKIETEITEQDRNNTYYRFSFVKNNRFYTKTDVIPVNDDDKILNIELQTFRDRLAPGQEETWTLRITDKNKKPLNAEIVATLYDASLDKLTDNHDSKSWTMPLYQHQYDYNRLEVSEIGFGSTNTIQFDGMPINYSILPPQYRVPRNMNWFETRQNDGWQTTILDYLIGNKYGQNIGNVLRGAVIYRDGNLTSYRLQLSAEGAKILDEITVIGYGTVKKSNSTGAVSSFFQYSSIYSDHQSLGYSVLSLNEVLVGKIAGIRTQSDNENPLSMVKVRKNFDETVFFKPQIHTESDGTALISFKMNEALTRWKFNALAHTIDLKRGAIVRAVVTTKKLMVIPNMPRFLREGDEIELSAKISNLETGKILRGQAVLRLFDATTMQPIDDVFKLTQTQVDWSAKAGESTVAKWRIKIPAADNLPAVTWRIVAKTDGLSDGEENTLPILPKNILFTESKPLSIAGQSSQTVAFPNFEKQEKQPSFRHHSWSIDVITNPVWHSVTGLAYSMEYPHECSEQLFSRFYANTLASSLLATTPHLKAYLTEKGNLSAVDSSNNYAEIRRTIMEEAPWIYNSYNDKQHFSRLFDLNRMALEQKQAFEKLATRRTTSGGLAWYPDGAPSWYISQHIVAGLAHLEAIGATVRHSDETQKLINGAVEYIDNQIVAFYKKGKSINDNRYYHGSDEQLAFHYLYARSFYPNIPKSNNVQAAFDSVVQHIETNWATLGIYEQAMSALALHRIGKIDLAKEITNSLSKRAIRDSLGMYFLQKKGYLWYEMPVETQAMMIELFYEVAQDTPSVSLMKNYLLNLMQNGHWYSTKATTEAIYALIKIGGYVNKMDNVNIISTNYALQKAVVATQKEDKGFLNITLKGSDMDAHLAKTRVENHNEQAISGSITWRFYADMDKIENSNTNDSLVILRKKTYKIATVNGKDTLIDIKNTPLSIGDRLQVVLAVSIKKPLEYVHLKDSRPSNCEPVDVLSKREWTGNTSFYQTTRDVSTNFFFDRINIGDYTFSYMMTVQQNGEFASGVAHLSCMYAPYIAVYTEGGRMKVD